MKKLWPVEDLEGFGQRRTGQVDLGVDLGARSTRGSTWESTSPMGVDYSVDLPLYRSTWSACFGPEHVFEAQGRFLMVRIGFRVNLMAEMSSYTYKYTLRPSLLYTQFYSSSSLPLI